MRARHRCDFFSVPPRNKWEGMAQGLTMGLILAISLCKELDLEAISTVLISMLAGLLIGVASENRAPHRIIYAPG